MPGFSFLLLKLRGVVSQAHCGLLAYATQPCVHIIPLIDQLRALKKGLLTKCFGVLSVFGGGKLLFQKLPSSRETGGDSWQGEWRHCGIYMVTRCVNHKPIPMKVELNSERKPE